MAKVKCKFKTGLDCPVCHKEIVLEDILDMGFIRQANSQPALLAACEELINALSPLQANNWYTIKADAINRLVAATTAAKPK